MIKFIELIIAVSIILPLQAQAIEEATVPSTIIVPLSLHPVPEFKSPKTFATGVYIKFELLPTGRLIVTPILPPNERRLTFGAVPDTVKRDDPREFKIAGFGGRFLRLFELGGRTFAISEKTNWMNGKKQIGLIQLQPVLGPMPSYNRGTLKAVPWMLMTSFGSLYTVNTLIPGLGQIGFLAGALAGAVITYQLLADEASNAGVSNKTKLRPLKYKGGASLIVDDIIQNELGEITDVRLITNRSDGPLYLSALVSNSECESNLIP